MWLRLVMAIRNKIIINGHYTQPYESTTSAYFQVHFSSKGSVNKYNLLSVMLYFSYIMAYCRYRYTSYIFAICQKYSL